MEFINLTNTFFVRVLTLLCLITIVIFVRRRSAEKRLDFLSNEEEEVKKKTKKSRSERETQNSFVLLLFLVFLFQTLHCSLSLI